MELLLIHVIFIQYRIKQRMMKIFFIKKIRRKCNKVNAGVTNDTHYEKKIQYLDQLLVLLQQWQFSLKYKN